MRRKENKKPLIPLFAKILLVLAVIALLIFEISNRNAEFAEWMTSNPGYLLRRSLAFVSNVIPFSLGELLVVLSPLIVISVIVTAARKNGFRARVRFLAGFLALVSLFYTSYVFMLGVGYQRTRLNSRLGLPSAEINEQSLVDTMLALKGECESLLDEISYLESGSSEANISFDEMCDEILEGYKRLEADYPELNIKTFDSRAKQVYLSRALTAFEISGVYTFFTGESNVNVYYPDYGIPFTLAHELAHQRGIARENEANFIAFLVCARAENAYVRYSAYMNMFEYVSSALSRTNRDRFREIYLTVDPRIRGEISAFNDFYYAHKNELMSKISDFLNDNYLKASGTEGIISYGLVVELCVAYYADKPK